MENIIKIRQEEINNTNLVGNFLHEEQGELLFLDEFNHLLFEFDESSKSNEEYFNGSITFDDYIQKFMGICSKVSIRPSLLFLNCVPQNASEVLNKDKRNYTFLTGLDNDEDYQKFSSNPSITCVQSGVKDTLKRLVESRSGIDLHNDVFVFFNEPEDISNLHTAPNIETILSVCKSRRIYIVFNFKEKEKYIEMYGQEAYQIIEDYCFVK